MRSLCRKVRLRKDRHDKGARRASEHSPGIRDNCADACRAKVEKEGKYYANHVYNPFFYEGTKTYIYEVYEQLGRIPENIFIPLGNGTLFIGAIKELEELLAAGVIDRMPSIVAIQSENCDPL